MMWFITFLVLSGSSVQPTDQSLVFYNARMALREGKTHETLKLWLLRNTIESSSKVISHNDSDFLSTTWAALGKLGLCQDGIPTDEKGAGLWPLALHNWIIRNMRRSPPASQLSPFDTFELKRQQRLISLLDVLNKHELKHVRFFRSSCILPKVISLKAGEGLLASLSDKTTAAKLLRYLLELSRKTMKKGKFKGHAVIEARIFDLNLKLAELAARKARKNMKKSSRKAKQKGLSKSVISAIKNKAPTYTFSTDSEEAQILKKSLKWSVSEWMSLSSKRRLFLFNHSLNSTKNPEILKPLVLGIIDYLLKNKNGKELNIWIAYFNKIGKEENQQDLWKGERGQKLLSLDLSSGFREQSVIALHRGVHFLSEGNLPEALRSMAYALKNSEDSKKANKIITLSRRWLSFVASQFKVTDELYSMLQALVPRRDYTIILENLLWHAALGADKISFDRCVRYQKSKKSLSEKIDLLRPLAMGNAGEFITTIRDALDEYPYFILRFLKKFIGRLEMQDGDIRSKHLKTIRMLREVIDPLTQEENQNSGQSRAAEALILRCNAIIDGLAGMPLHSNPYYNAHTLSPDNEVFAGSLRLAPSNPLPWPFKVPIVQAPSVFTLIPLVPEEWKNYKNEFVFGWRIGN